MLFLLDYLYTSVYAKSIPRNKISYIRSLNEEFIDYVFLGSSRVHNTIDSDVIESITGKKVINLGIQGAKIDDYLLMLKLLNNQKIKVKTVFIQIDYVFNNEGTSMISKSYLMPYIRDSLISSHIKERDLDYYKLKFIPFYRYLVYDYKLGFREFFNSIIGKKPKFNLENGYNPLFGSINTNLKSSLPDYIKKDNKIILEINKFAKELNIEVSYFMAPFCFNTANKDFSSKLKEKIPNLIDYSQLFLEDTYFFNCSHLNDKGAKEFSKRVAFDILKKNQNN
ncbi:hypothetical protein [Lutibacter flavus]|uniref:SGNH/GDSL hydrolase family protein n=1 Tax=Lutibacter flavus TaxID=691689 RepID=A0A238VQT6_9FLAO|nr:hypothetical protein [Lutibacter flavus]SNR36514.1 hypothetical protein SAMN04488111_0878 [Lutibacter flavus]